MNAPGNILKWHNSHAKFRQNRTKFFVSWNGDTDSMAILIVHLFCLFFFGGGARGDQNKLYFKRQNETNERVALLILIEIPKTQSQNFDKNSARNFPSHYHYTIDTIHS